MVKRADCHIIAITFFIFFSGKKSNCLLAYSSSSIYLINHDTVWIESRNFIISYPAIYYFVSRDLKIQTLCDFALLFFFLIKLSFLFSCCILVLLVLRHKIVHVGFSLHTEAQKKKISLKQFIVISAYLCQKYCSKRQVFLS